MFQFTNDAEEAQLLEGKWTKHLGIKLSGKKKNREQLVLSRPYRAGELAPSIYSICMATVPVSKSEENGKSEKAGKSREDNCTTSQQSKPVFEVMVVTLQNEKK